jgi:hypothetical protein
MKSIHGTHLSSALRPCTVIIPLLLFAAACGSADERVGASRGEATGKTAQAEGTCGPSQEPGPNGTCTPCSLSITGDLPVASLTELLSVVDVGSASYQVVNGTGTFYPSNLASGTFGIKLKSVSSAVSLPNITGTSNGYNYQAVIQSIPQLNATWGAWKASPSGSIITPSGITIPIPGGIIIPATLNGQVNAHLTVNSNPIQVFSNDIQLHFNGLPVTITFGTDAQGNATIPTSSVVIGNVSQYVTVTGAFLAEVLGVVQDMLPNVAPGLQGLVSSQFPSFLDSGGPFWANLMVGLADQGASLVDPSRRRLPKLGTATTGGTPTSYTFLDMKVPTLVSALDPAADAVVAADFNAAGLCYLDCTAMTTAQACANVSCGPVDDGCGDTIQCPDLCTSGDHCDGNYCYSNYYCSPACQPGYICEWPNGGYLGVCVVNHRCKAPLHFCNNACVPAAVLCP